jgi:hypothetical protein
MSAKLYDACPPVLCSLNCTSLPEWLSTQQYGVCLPLWCLPTCLMSCCLFLRRQAACRMVSWYLHDVFLPLRRPAICMIYACLYDAAYLYDVWVPVWFLRTCITSDSCTYYARLRVPMMSGYCTIRCLAACMVTSCFLSVWCLATCIYDFCLTVRCLSTCTMSTYLYDLLICVLPA